MSNTIDKMGIGKLWLNGTLVTATGAEINAATDVSGRAVSLTDANYTVLAANSGKPHLIPNVSADRTITLPAASAGLEFEFFGPVDLAVADGHDWIFATNATDELFKGGVVFLDVANAISHVGSDGTDDDAFQVNVPGPGTRVKFVSDGSHWYVTGTVAAAAAPAFS